MEFDVLWQILDVSHCRQWHQLLLLDESIWHDEQFGKWRNVAIWSHWGNDLVITNANYKELLLWLRGVDLDEKIIKKICVLEKEEVFYEILDKNIDNELLLLIFTLGVWNGRLGLLKWLYDRHNAYKIITRNDVYSIIGSDVSWHVHVFKWIDEKFGIEREFITSDDNSIFRWAAAYGQLELLQWLIERYRLTREDATDCGNDAFVGAAEYGHTHVLKWLTDTFQLTKEDATVMQNGAIQGAAKNGHIDTIKWIIERFEL